MSSHNLGLPVKIAGREVTTFQDAAYYVRKGSHSAIRRKGSAVGKALRDAETLVEKRMAKGALKMWLQERAADDEFAVRLLSDHPTSSALRARSACS